MEYKISATSPRQTIIIPSRSPAWFINNKITAGSRNRLIFYIIDTIQGVVMPVIETSWNFKIFKAKNIC